MLDQIKSRTDETGGGNGTRPPTITFHLSTLNAFWLKPSKAQEILKAWLLKPGSLDFSLSTMFQQMMKFNILMYCSFITDLKIYASFCTSAICGVEQRHLLCSTFEFLFLMMVMYVRFKMSWIIVLSFPRRQPLSILSYFFLLCNKCRKCLL